MNVFDIIGPVMVGPSSSHTAGAVRIGRVAHALLNDRIKDVSIKLHGSFARTYQGHGTDKAIIAGLLGMLPDDLHIRDSLQIAKDQGIRFTFEEIELKDAHPNTALIELKGFAGQQISVQGSSVGGGNIVINRINGLNVEFTGQFHTLIIWHKDTAGTIAAVTGVMGTGINIAQMRVFRFRKGGDAIMIIETDQKVRTDMKASIDKLSQTKAVAALEPL